MARLADRLPDNAPGDFYVDSSCIDCDTCRIIAPAVFGDGDDHARVKLQPHDDAARRRAAMALVSCPVSAIGSAALGAAELTRAAAHAFPELVGGGVYYCGYASEDSYGASSYLIVRPGGNVLVDSPRAARPLIEGLERLGGVALMFLTHRDDVADHAQLAAHFGCQRIMHEADIGHGTRSFERKLTGTDVTELADGLLAIPVPGHTRGSAALLWNGILFSGDHLWWDRDAGRLAASRSVCWYSWEQQTQSVERLLDHEITWVLPGHGRPHRAASPAAMRAELGALVARMKNR